MAIKRAALFCREDDKELTAEKLATMQEYAEAHNMVITQTFCSEAEALNDVSEYDCVLCCGDILMLPLAGIEIINL